MQPLIDDLKEAWVNGVNTYDAAKKENFQMYVWYQYSLHDLPAFALFVAWCVHGRFPCPQCKAALKFHWLPAGGKYSCFDLHRQFLPMDHPFRKDKKNFMKGKVVKHSATPALTGTQIHEQLKSMEPDPNRPGYFLGVLCAKELSHAMIDDMEELAPELLYKLEKILHRASFIRCNT